MVAVIAADRSHTPKGARLRAALVEAGEHLFADAGFHGASMRDLARAAGVPLATAGYHFARKEQLYAAVLGRIAGDLDAALAPAVAEPDPGDALAGFVAALVAWSTAHPRRVRLLLRELLDNPVRVARAANLPLAPFLTNAAAIVAAAQRAGLARAEHPEVAVLGVVGAVSYLVAARPTVDRIVGRTRAKLLARAFAHDATALAHRTLAFTGGRRAR